MTADEQTLQTLGDERAVLLARLEEIRVAATPIIKAMTQAGVPQKKIADTYGVTREAIRQIQQSA